MQGPADEIDQERPHAKFGGEGEAFQSVMHSNQASMYFALAV